MRCIGQGLTSLSIFCAIMVPVSQKAYNKINSRLVEATTTVAIASMQNAVEEEVKLTASKDIAVSGDGSWKTRGHS